MHIAHRLFVALFVVLAIPLETAEAKKAAPEKSYDTVVLWAVGMERKDQRKIEESVAKILAKKDV